LVLAVVLPLSMLIYSNSRITEAKETLRAEMNAGFTQFRLEFNDRFSSIDRKLDEILRILADHDTRIRAIEARIH
jgi:hypothetical protein